VGLAVVPGQDIAGFPGPVCEGALAYLAAGDRKAGDCHGEPPGRWLAHHLLWCHSRRGGHAVPCAGRHVHGVRDTGLALYGAVSCGGIADGGWGRRSPGRLSLRPGPAGTVPSASAFRARAPGSSRSHRAARCAPRGAAPALASVANGSKLGRPRFITPPGGRSGTQWRTAGRVVSRAPGLQAGEPLQLAAPSAWRAAGGARWRRRYPLTGGQDFLARPRARLPGQ